MIALDTEIEVVSPKTGIEFKRIVRMKGNKEVKMTQKIVEFSSPDISNFECEFAIHLDVGVGHIKYKDESSYFGLIKSDKKQPFLMGIWTDSTGQDNVKLDHGLEFNLTAWSESEKKLPELIRFLKEQTEKGCLPKNVYDFFVALTFIDDTDLIYAISNINFEYLKGVAIKTINDNALLKEYVVSVDEFFHNKEELLFNIELKNGDPTMYMGISLEQLTDLATTVAKYYVETKKLIHDVQMLNKRFSAKNINLEAIEDLFDHLKLPKTTRLYVSSLEHLDNVDFYIKEESSSEIEQLDGVEFRYLILSTSGRAGSYVDRDNHYNVIEQARRWVDYYMIIQIASKNSSGKIVWFDLIEIESSKVDAVLNKILRNA